MDTVTRRFADTPLDDLSRAMLIADPEVRSTVERAERAFALGDLPDGAELLALAFELTLAQFRERQPWRRRGNLDQHRLRKAVDALKPPRANSTLLRKFKEILSAVPTARRGLSSDIDKIATQALGGGIGNTDQLLRVLQGFGTELQYLSERAEAGALVTDVGDHLWFRTRVGRVQLLGPGLHHFVTADPSLRPHEVSRASNFVVDTVLRQQRLTDSPAPAWSSAGIAERRAWDQIKETILEVARRTGQVTIDDLIVELDNPSPDDVEPALGELVEEGHLERAAAELYLPAPQHDADGEDAP